MLEFAIKRDAGWLVGWQINIVARQRKGLFVFPLVYIFEKTFLPKITGIKDLAFGAKQNSAIFYVLSLWVCLLFFVKECYTSQLGTDDIIYGVEL